MKLLAKIIIVVVIFIGGFYFGQQQALSPSNGSQPVAETESANQPEKQATTEISVSLMLDFGNGQVRTYNQIELAKNSTVFGLLEKATAENNFKLQSKDYGDLGVFIEAIGDIKNDTAGDRFWQCWVNNEYAQIGASNYQLNDGDVVEWKFIKGQIN